MIESGPIYDRIGVHYADLRKPDPRIARRIRNALGTSASVINVGAGTGSYEPTDIRVTAVEPSVEMIRQRKSSAVSVIQCGAEELPFVDNTFDGAMAVLTVHHWADQAAGLREMRRVARGPVVILTFAPTHPGCWLTEYFPQLRTLDEAQMPRIHDYEAWIGAVDISPVPVPSDCSDGFLYAYWRRPEAYLDPRVRRAISSFWTLPGLEAGIAKLEADLATGEWMRRYRYLLDLNELDTGYRLVVATP